MRGTVARSRLWLAFAGFLAIAGFFLFTEHRAHVFGALPLLFLLACPLLHLFGHGGHGRGGGHAYEPGRGDESHGHHEPKPGATRDDWRS